MKKGKKTLESPKMNVVTVFSGLLSRLKKVREENIVKREMEVGFMDIGLLFLDACTHLYMRVCPSVRRSVGPWVGYAFFSNRGIRVETA